MFLFCVDWLGDLDTAIQVGFMNAKWAFIYLEAPSIQGAKVKANVHKLLTLIESQLLVEDHYGNFVLWQNNIMAVSAKKKKPKRIL